MIRRLFPTGPLAASRHRAATGLTAGIALIALTGAGCKSVVHAGAAATIGDHRISASDLQKATDALYQGQAQLSITHAAAQQQALTQIITTAIDDRIAANLKITAPPASVVEQGVQQLEQQYGGLDGLLQAAARANVVLSAATLPTYVSSELRKNAIETTLFDKQAPPDSYLESIYQANLSIFQTQHSDRIVVKTQDEAKQIKAQLDADPTKFAALAKQDSIDTATKAKGGDNGGEARGTIDSAVESAIFAAKPGALLGPIEGQAGWYVVKVLSLSIISFADAKPQIVSAVKSGQADQGKYLGGLLQAQRAVVARELDIHVNSRFGSWSAADATVDPDLGALSTPGKAPLLPSARPSADQSGTAGS